MITFSLSIIPHELCTLVLEVEFKKAFLRIDSHTDRKIKKIKIKNDTYTLCTLRITHYIVHLEFKIDSVIRM